MSQCGAAAHSVEVWLRGDFSKEKKEIKTKALSLVEEVRAQKNSTTLTSSNGRLSNLDMR